MKGAPLSTRSVSTGVGVVVRDEHGRVLLGRRWKDGQPFPWAIPGGVVEAGESILDCAARELREETGLRAQEFRRVTEVDEQLVGDVPRGAADRLFAVEVLSYEGVPTDLEPDRIGGWRWFHPDELPDELYLPTRAILELCDGGREAGGLLHVFDMDGTILMGTTACAEIGAVLKTEGLIEAIEVRFARGELDTRGFAAEIHAAWGDVTDECLAAALDRCRIIGNLRTVLSDIRARGDVACLITMSPSYFAEQLGIYGFDEIFGSRFPGGGQQLEAADILTPADKPRIVEAVGERHGIPWSRVLAYGDSSSDLPLFELATVSIAVNAIPAVREVATRLYDGDDLFAAYQMALEEIALRAPSRKAVTRS